VQVFFNLALFMTKLRVLVLYFPDFMSNVFKILTFRNNTITAKPEKYYNIIRFMGCRILGISYSLKQNDTQTKFFEKFWSIKGQKAGCFCKKNWHNFFCSEFTCTSQSINLSSTVWNTLQNLCKCLFSRLTDPNSLQFTMLIHGFS
jgi:hypothetical protein